MNRKRMMRMNLNEFLRYAADQDREAQAILEAQRRRPLVQGDRLQRSTVVIDGKAYWQSSIIRKDNSIEVWLKRDIDYDDSIHETTHVGWTPIAGFQISQPSEDFTERRKLL